MAAKRILQSSIIGQQGVNLLEEVLLRMGFLWYPTGSVEAGIDGFIEIRDSETGEVSNSIIQVQVKATDGQFQAETASSFDYVCRPEDLDYWLRGNAPVILVPCRPRTHGVYWASVRDSFATAEARKSRKMHLDKKLNRLDQSARTALVALAMPRNAGVYFAAPRLPERLVSNLLRVASFGDHLYVAETEFRDPKKLWARLAELTEGPRGEWILKHKCLLSFHDLGKHPWGAVCDLGTLDELDTREWAFSESADRRREFVQLLKQCLRQRARQLDVAYSKHRDCYYFTATKDLSQQELQYANTSRVVFRGYRSKQDPERVAYYRHSAFKGEFRYYEGRWYLEITPTYYFTRDGYRLYRYYEDRLRGIKEFEKNSAVLGQVIMWADYLSRSGDLFTPAYPFLRFGGLASFSAERGLDDESWRSHDEFPAPEDEQGYPLEGALFE